MSRSLSEPGEHKGKRPPTRPPADVLQERLDSLTADFEVWLDVFDRTVPFSRSGQRDWHVATLVRWKQLEGRVDSLVSDQEFMKDLYETLGAWGIGRRGSRLRPFDQFCQAVSAAAPALTGFQGMRLSDPAAGEAGLSTRLWTLVADLGVVENDARMVAGTKTVHHILPLLVVPIDRMYTGAFFGWSPQAMQYHQDTLFSEAFAAFTAIARSVDLDAFTGSGWRMSPAKLIDNAIVGFCKEQGLVKSGRSGASPSSSRVRGGKYSPLRAALSVRSGSYTMTFTEIDDIVGGLPRSARDHREWWANHLGNPQGDAWMTAGKVVDHVDLTGQRVRFRNR